MNSVDLNVDGVKFIQFNDGSKIEYQPHQDTVLNAIWGTLTHLLIGKITFTDKQNGLTGWYEISAVKKKPKDYFHGEIFKNG